MEARGSLPPSATVVGDERTNPVRLEGDGSMSAAYDAYGRALCRRGASTYCMLAILFFLAAIPLRLGATPGSLLPVRLIGAAAMALVFGLLQTNLGRRHPRALALLVPTVAGVSLHAIAFRSGGSLSPINTVTIFAMLGVALLIPWPAPWTAIACALMVGSYAGVALVARGTPTEPPSLDNLIATTAFAAVAIALTAQLERTRWREFAQRWAIRAAHREARASAGRYRSLVDTAPSAIVALSADGRVTEFNRESERVLGWRREDMLGRAPTSLCAGGGESEAIGHAVTRALTGEPTHGLEVRLPTAAEGERTFVCNVSRLVDDEGRPGDVIVCAQDITEVKRTQEALRQSEARLREVVASSPVVLFALDPAGVLTLSEGRGLDRLGISPGEVVGRSVIEVVRGLGPSAADSLVQFERALAGESVIWTGVLGDASFECRLLPLRDGNGAIAGVLGVAIDVTERTRAEEARLALERALLERQKLESLGVLAGGVAHDFNNLLLTVLGSASHALGELPADSPARERLRKIETAAQHGSDLIRRMLTYAGKGEIVPEAVEVNVVVEELRDLLRDSIPLRVAVRLELDDDLPAVAADPTQIRQVVMNLIMNAAEAVGDAGGEIRVRTFMTELDANTLSEVQHGAGSAPGPHLCLEVADTGAGMDAATAARIFDPFFSTKVTGRGLGLATVLGVVRAHRGALALASQPGKGTTFRVYLPIGETPVRRPAPPSAVVAAVDPARTVLLVDDEADVRAVTAHMLERLGCSVLQAGDGREGVEVFRAHAELIDAVLIDLTLPRLSGDRACHEIRNIRPDARVIVMSGFNEDTTRDRLADIGLAGFLRKPFSVADLRSTMDRALN